MPKQVDILKHGPFYPGTRRLLDPTDDTLPRELWELAVILNANAFTTVRWNGRGTKDRREFKTFDGALADVGTDMRAMVYAITARGRSVHIAPVDYCTYKTLMEMVK